MKVQWQVSRSKRAERWSNLRAPRPARLPRTANTTTKIQPADSRYERGTSGGQVRRDQASSIRRQLSGIARLGSDGPRLGEFVAGAATAIHRYSPGLISTVASRRGSKDIDSQIGTGSVAEWSKAPVLKTGVRESAPWVRIPPDPPLFCEECFSACADAGFFRCFQGLRRWAVHLYPRKMPEIGLSEPIFS